MTPAAAESRIQIKFGAQGHELNIPIAAREEKTRVAESLIASGLSLLEPSQFQQIQGYAQNQLTFTWLAAD
jgi:hypothetical protein